MSRHLATCGSLLLSLGISTQALAAPAAPENAPLASPQSARAGEPAAEREKEQTTLLAKKTRVTGYAGVDVAYTRMFDREGAVGGLQGALLFNRRLHVGLAGYVWSNPLSGPDGYYGEDQSFQTAYGGFTLRYTLLQHGPFSVTGGGLVGGGVIALTSDERHWDDNYENDDIKRRADGFAVFQPDVAVHANLTRWLRAGVTGGYRFTSGVNQFTFDDSDVRGFLVGGSVQIGWF